MVQQRFALLWGRGAYEGGGYKYKNAKIHPKFSSNTKHTPTPPTPPATQIFFPMRHMNKKIRLLIIMGRKASASLLLEESSLCLLAVFQCQHTQHAQPLHKNQLLVLLLGAPRALCRSAAQRTVHTRVEYPFCQRLCSDTSRIRGQASCMSHSAVCRGLCTQNQDSECEELLIQGRKTAAVRRASRRQAGK